MDKFYITTAIAYTSHKPHVGNSYEMILADAIARYKRMRGYDVFFLTGTDEHGQKIQNLAKESGIDPKQYVDKISDQIKELAKIMNISYNMFIRTTDEIHVKTVQKIFKRLHENGDIYKGEYSGWYCTPCESFWTQNQLVDGNCPDCGRIAHEASEEAYFFKMSKYTDRLLQYYDSNPMFIKPEFRKSEMINNFIKPGIHDLCVSRTSFDWGIPVDFDSGHVVYVWLDALVNYISAIGYDGQGESYKRYWPADLHVIGKDILRFHTIYWPIFLMALQEELPKQVFGHSWLLVGSDKMSKSVGNVVYVDDLVSEFGTDAIRYCCLREMPYGDDGTVSDEGIKNRINADLANNLGNLTSRTVAMAEKYFEGCIPKDRISTEFDAELINLAAEVYKNVTIAFDELRFAQGLEEIFKLVSRTNKYIDETSPWKLNTNSDDRKKLAGIIYNLLEGIRIIGILIEPVMPDSAKMIRSQIGVRDENWEKASQWGGFPDDTKVSRGSIIFPRIEVKVNASF